MSLRCLPTPAVTRAVVIGCVGLGIVLGAGRAPLLAQRSAHVTPTRSQLGWDLTPAGLTDAAWDSMRATIERDQYGLRRDGDVYRGVNYAQHLDVAFTQAGVEVTPQGAERAWRWGLRLAGYGYGERRAPLADPKRVMTGNRVEYRRGALVEWYINARDGVEQGFTLQRPPTRREGNQPLIVDLRATGDLRPSVADDGQAVAWRDAQGTTALSYRGLKAWDATRRPLVALMEELVGTLRFRVEDEGAIYPVTIDPTIQQGKLTPSDSATMDFFGESVAISGDTAIVGTLSGAAYIFERDRGGTNTWGQVVKLTASDGGMGDRFGASVSISGDTAIVGAPGLFFRDSGAAYIFERDRGGTNAWGEVRKLTGSDPDDVRFGSAVSISRDTTIVGANSSMAGTSERAFGAGAAYLFERGPSGFDAWDEVTRIVSGRDPCQEFDEPPPCDSSEFPDFFGGRVSISGDTAIVGAVEPVERLRPPSISSGAAYVFARDQGGPNTWGKVATLDVRDDGSNYDEPGASRVAISGHAAIVGGAGPGGSAWIFARDQGAPNAWGEVAELKGPFSSGDADGDGPAVSISGDIATVGSTDLSGLRAHVFARDQGGPNTWGESVTLVASDASYDPNGPGPHLFGRSVAIDGSLAIVGAPADDVNGIGSGSVYICQIDSLSNDAACRAGRRVINNLVSLSVDETSCCAGSEFIIAATLTNLSTATIVDPFFEVTALTGGNVLKNADGGPRGVGATLSSEGPGPGGSTGITFIIGLASRKPFRFLVDLRGDPVQ